MYTIQSSNLYGKKKEKKKDLCVLTLKGNFVTKVKGAFGKDNLGFGSIPFYHKSETITSICFWEYNLSNTKL